MTEPHPHDNAPTAGRAVAKLTEIVETQQETIDMLVTAVAHLRGDPGTDGTFGTPSPGEGPRPEHFRWRDLDRTAASEAWHRLISWVGWLVEHYQLWETVPECWPEHWPHIQELSALYLAWWDAYIDPNAYRDTPLRFHERLAMTITRLGGWDVRKCVTRGHTLASKEGTWSSDWRSNAEHTADDDLQHRPPRTTAAATTTSAGGELW